MTHHLQGQFFFILKFIFVFILNRNELPAGRLQGTARISRMAPGAQPTEVLSPPCGIVRNRIQQSGASMSAPSSPASLKSNIPKVVAGSRIRPPAPNIIVEKGRIEFVKTDVPPPQQQSSKLVMGTKIFRPPAPPKKSDPLPSTEESTPVNKKWIPPVAKDSSAISFRERSASPKATRESTPPDSKIPSARIAKPQQQQPDVLVNSQRVARPGFNKSRETSPSPAAAAKCVPPVTTSTTKSAATSGGSIPVSPNLIRWRAKLSSGVTGNLNSSVAGNKKTTTSVGVSKSPQVSVST